MRLARCACLLAVFVGFMSTTHAADPKPSANQPPPAKKPAATTPPAADDEFLEFLGSVDAEGADEDWLDYLTRTDIERVAKAPKKPPETEAKK